MRDKRRKSTTPGGEPAPPAEAGELPERWSVQRKAELVLRLLRGEALDAVSRENGSPILAVWQAPTAGSDLSRQQRSLCEPPPFRGKKVVTDGVVEAVLPICAVSLDFGVTRTDPLVADGADIPAPACE